MDPVTSVTQVLEAVQAAKAAGSAFCTNLFASQAKLQSWIDHGELVGQFRDRSAFFFRKDRDFLHLYFCAPDKASLQHQIAAVPNLRTQPIALDLVGNEAAVKDLANMMEPAGLRRYSRLVRLGRPSHPSPSESPPGSPEIIWADQSDCQPILNLLEGSFDRFADQLPTAYEVEEAIVAHRILAIKCEGVLAAMLFFETQGLTSTIRYWVVAEEFQSRRFGSALMRHYFAAHPNVRRFMLWVTADNENAVSKYRHYGYAPDELVDYVLVNELVPVHEIPI